MQYVHEYLRSLPNTRCVQADMSVLRATLKQGNDALKKCQDLMKTAKAIVTIHSDHKTAI